MVRFIPQRFCSRMYSAFGDKESVFHRVMPALWLLLTLVFLMIHIPWRSLHRRIAIPDVVLAAYRCQAPDRAAACAIRMIGGTR